MANSIGSFEFLTLSGNHEPLKQECVVMSRPGVNGVAVWLTGGRGAKLTLRSAVDAADLEAARDLYVAYTGLIGADPVALVWCNLYAADENFNVIVLDVRPVSIKAIMGGVGGLNPPSLGWCECDWDVIAVPVTP